LPLPFPLPWPRPLPWERPPPGARAGALACCFVGLFCCNCFGGSHDVRYSATNLIARYSIDLLCLNFKLPYSTNTQYFPLKVWWRKIRHEKNGNVNIDRWLQGHRTFWTRTRTRTWKIIFSVMANHDDFGAYETSPLTENFTYYILTLQSSLLYYLTKFNRRILLPQMIAKLSHLKQQYDTIFTSRTNFEGNPVS
jgi:hypothetical protein